MFQLVNRQDPSMRPVNDDLELSVIDLTQHLVAGFGSIGQGLNGIKNPTRHDFSNVNCLQRRDLSRHLITKQDACKRWLKKSQDKKANHSVRLVGGLSPVQAFAMAPRVSVMEGSSIHPRLKLGIELWVKHPYPRGRQSMRKGQHDEPHSNSRF
jgi:hypothetical protein